MTDLYELLESAEGSDAIRRCWGEVPPFNNGEALQVRQSRSPNGEVGAVLTALVITSESEFGNQCKPSLLVVQFDDVSHWEYGPFAEMNDIPHSELIASPPMGATTVAFDGFLIVCQRIRVLSCVHQPFKGD